MEDKNDILLKQFFEEAAKQTIEDNGFTERVMMNLPETDMAESRVRRLSHLWTLFCLVIGLVVFWLTSGWPIIEGAISGGKQMLINAIEVFLITAPTTEISINPWVVVLLLGFVLVFLPYQTIRKLSATL
ncbi:DUF5056 domain-containing protein [Xylanibacter ruminicola]|uniref:Uncharacterized protein n=1 Tax=Xylanibacter ruminicola TaxID=839 RepID=A0A1M6YSZ2_XYLRU|nr:DUF5056 domain-containing protein [Xylanibacter ruminicola]SHL21225.1 protein of unknown function [Xylanibacter ruminicola]